MSSNSSGDAASSSGNVSDASASSPQTWMHRARVAFVGDAWADRSRRFVRLG